MKQLLAVALLIIGVTAAPTTQKEGTAAPDRPLCTLGLAEIPGVGPVRLGMTPEQVLALFPGSKDDPEVRSKLSRPPSPFGTSDFVIIPQKYASKDKFAGVNRITFNLLDGRVSSFSVGYDGPAWPHVDDFVSKFVEGTKFPPVEAWEAAPGLDTQLKVLACPDFEVRVFAGGEGGNLNYVLMNDLAAARTLKERRVKAREKAKQETKQ